MPTLLATARNWVDHFHVNAGARVEREGRTVWLKRRRWLAGAVMQLANGFFRLAGNPVEALVDPSAWRDWEIDCFRRLHGPAFRAGSDPDGRPWVEILPGADLSSHLQMRTLTPEMLYAAAAELQRAHRLACPHYGAGWSHGDPHTGNFLYDENSGRARLIDFEVRHLHTLCADDRHADDVLVLLQDVCGRCRAEDWPAFAQAVLDGYGEPGITSRLAGRLQVPRRIFARLWWAVRTTWMRRAELEPRMSELSRRLGGVTSAA